MTTSQLAERLGYASDTRLLIVNADDFGSLHGTNTSIVAGFRHGLTSTTLMVPCPWAAAAASAVREAADHRPTVRVGVHLTLTSEWSGYRWASITGERLLHAADGRMHRDQHSFAREVLAHGARGLAAVRAECEAQIEVALGWGIDVTHLDGHMGVMYSTPQLLDIVIDLAATHRVPMRMVSPSHERALGFACRQPATDRGVLFPDSFVETYLDALAVHERVLPTLRPGVTEILLHPSADSAELRAAFADADERVANHRFVMDGRLRELIDQHGLVPIGFDHLRAVQRAG